MWPSTSNVRGGVGDPAGGLDGDAYCRTPKRSGRLRRGLRVSTTRQSISRTGWRSGFWIRAITRAVERGCAGISPAPQACRRRLSSRRSAFWSGGAPVAVPAHRSRLRGGAAAGPRAARGAGLTARHRRKQRRSRTTRPPASVGSFNDAPVEWPRAPGSQPADGRDTARSHRSQPLVAGSWSGPKLAYWRGSNAGREPRRRADRALREPIRLAGAGVWAGSCHMRTVGPDLASRSSVVRRREPPEGSLPWCLPATGHASLAVNLRDQTSSSSVGTPSIVTDWRVAADRARDRLDLR